MRVFRRAAFAASVIGLIVVTSATSAAVRKWTDASGQFSVEAEFVEFKSGEVFLKKSDGSVISVAASKLSEADRLYLTSRIAGKSATPAPADKTEAAAPLSLDKTFGADGKITRAAWSKFAQGFRQFDADGDDALSGAEIAAAGREDLLLKLVDMNGDGKIVRTEWAQLAQSFARLDKNRDGGLEQTELEAAATEAQSRAKGSASLAANDAKSTAPAGPVVWRGQIQGRSAIELTINGNQIVGRELGPGGQPGNSLGSGTYSMTGDGKLGNMDAVYVDGPNSGQTCMGIYQMQGDTLMWCVNNRGQRPQDFSGGNGNWLMSLTRVVTP